MSRSRRHFGIVAGAALVVTRPDIAFADDLAAEALAEKLFHEARAAMDAGRLAEGCKKLQDSHELDPAGGTVLLLAMCFEQQGRIASAWTRFAEALALARRDGRADRIERAGQRLAALEPRLPRLRIAIEGARPAGVVVRLDGSTLPRLALMHATPIDPGPHSLAVHAPARVPWRARFMAVEGRETRVSVPALAARASQRRDPGATQRSAGWALVGLGAASAVAGAAAGTAALRYDARADERCPDVDCGDTRAVAQSDVAADAAALATGALIASVVLGLAGAGVIWTAPRPADAGAMVRADRR